MKITILDGGTTNPGDISWQELADLGELTIYNETPDDLVIDRLQGADVAIITRIKMTKEVFENCPNLKYIGTLATGFNTIDLDEASKHGVCVCNVPHYCSKTVAQMVFAHLLQLCNHIDVHTNYVKNNQWKESLNFDHKVMPFYELSGKTLGIIGYGSIGRAVAEIAKAFGMNVLAYSKSPKEIETVSLETLFEKSDVITVHCALNEETKGMINLELLRKMKPTSFIINTARGAVINENDLAFALNNGIIKGAGIDVYSTEPPQANSSLLTAKNCFFTPHIAWSSKEARMRLVTAVAENLGAYMNGKTQNKVN